MNLARLLRVRPDEIRTRAQQAVSKRWAMPPMLRLIPSAAQPAFLDPPPAAAPAQVDKLCRHRFDLLGYQDLDFGSPINWHLDPVHGKRAPKIPWYRIPFLDFDRIGDHKVIWELNRHQHLVTLAQAGLRDEILAQWTYWQSENPYPIGINWASTLEVAFRALSWLWVRSIIGDFHPHLLTALHQHGWHIERYLSTYFSPNTHLLGEGVALFALGVMCPQIAQAARWQKRGWEIVLRQAEAQVRPDGFHFEQSTYYHIYALDFFQFGRLLAVRNGVPIPPAFDRTIAKMKDALAAISQAGPPPNFGDDDGGSLIMPPARPLAPSPARSVSLTNAGLYIMAAPNAQLFIDAGPQGALSAGHSHADALSIQLVRHGRRVLIDPGTFCYVCPERDRFRGTAAHNTLRVDGRDQSDPRGPFGWAKLSETVVDLWHTSETFDLFAGHHNGYTPFIHHRWVFGLKSKFWLVRDLVTGPGKGAPRARLDINWHFLDERDLTILPPAGHTWNRSIERWDWSPVYGRKESAFVLRFSKETVLPAEFAVLLVADSSGTFTQTAPGTYRYQESQATHEFVFGERFVYRCRAAEFSV
ncbi:MAG: alginate lyase family protein [Bryobacteraceae bacterium]|jgi:heparinase II/III-like protein